MLLAEKPYFLTNKEWYIYDENKKIYVLTKHATEKAKKSYEKFYKELNKK